MLWTESWLTTQLGSTAFRPAADVVDSSDDILLTLDVPGLTAEDLTIELEGDYLCVRGERKRPQLGDGSTYAFAERPYGAFERRVRVPKGVDPDRITAHLDNGVLSLIVPKPEQHRPKAIAIETGQRQLEAAAA